MRILHLASEYPPQAVHGLGRFVHDLAVAQAAAGDEVHVVANSLSGRDADTIRRGVHVHRVAFPPPPRAPHDVTTVTQFNIQVMERTAQLVRHVRPDVVNLHDWLTVPGGVPLAEVYRLPLVFTVHDTAHGKHFGRLGPLDGYMADLETWGVQASDRVICCSRAVERELVDTYLADAERVRVIPCGVDAATFEVHATPAHLAAFRTVLAEPDEPIVVYLGRLDPEKGLEVLIAAVPMVLDGGRKARFVIVGKGLMEASLREHVQRNGLAGAVRFVGYVGGAPLAQLLRVADVMVIPSTYEPFGIVALEGMINRLPVVVPDSTGLAEIVTDGVDGRTFRTGVAHDLAGRLIELLSDEGTRRCLGEEGYRTAAGRFAWPHLARLTRVVYSEAIASPRTDRRTIRSPGFVVTPSSLPPRTTEVGSTTIAPWTIVIAGRRLAACQRTLTAIVEHTRPAHQIVAVESGYDREVATWLTNLAHAGHIARVLINAPGTLPRDTRCAALVQAHQVLNEEVVEYVAWVLGDVQVRPHWLDVGLSVLRALPASEPIVVLAGATSDGESRQVAGHSVTVSPVAPSTVWLMHRLTLVRLGLPPVGFGDAELGGPGGHYALALEDAGCRFALLDGLLYAPVAETMPEPDGGTS